MPLSQHALPTQMRKDIEEVKQHSAWKDQQKQETKERNQEDSSPVQGGQLTLLEVISFIPCQDDHRLIFSRCC